MEIKEESRNDARNDDRKRSGEHFEYVVRILHNSCHYQSSDGLDGHNCPYNIGIPSEEPLLLDGWAVLDQHRDVSDHN